MTFGSAVTAAEVPAYLDSVRGGRGVSTELVEEFQRRFAIIGRSPLIDITEAQGRALQRRLDERCAPGAYRVGVGMLHSAPRVEPAVQRLVDAGVDQIQAIVLAPQYSPLILRGYEAAIERCRRRLPGVRIDIAQAWHQTPAFVASLAERVGQALAEMGERSLAPPVIFTAHSLPRVVVERDPSYREQIDATIVSVVERLGLPSDQWHFAYQSAGHSPAEWLTPDLADVLRDLAGAGERSALVAPVQFLADHLEVLYDIDVAARQQAEDAGIAFHRIAMPNTSPLLIEALAEVVERERSLLAL